MNVPIRRPAATLDSQLPACANEANPTIQQATVANKSKEIVLYCHLCDRKFVNENGMRMHLATSKDHKERVKRQIATRTLSPHSPAPTLDPQASGNRNKIAIQPNGLVFYCNVCEREFVSENGMRTHIETSKDHKEKARRQISYTALSPHSPSPTRDPQASRNRNKINLTVQKVETAIKPNGLVLYCNICEREFVNENEMRMHLETSKDHQKLVNMQKVATHAQDLKLAASLTSGTFESTILYGHLAHPQNPLVTPTYGFTEFGGSNLMHPAMMETSSLYGQAGNIITSLSHTSTELQSQAKKMAAYPQTYNYVPPPDQIPPNGGNAQAKSTSQKTVLKHKNLVPTVIPSVHQSVELKSLSEHCHTSEDLLKHQYLLCLFTADDIAGLCRCQNCGGD